MSQLDIQAAMGFISLLHGGAPGLLNVCSTGDWTGLTSENTTDGAVAVESYIRSAHAAGREGIYLRATTIGRQLGPKERGGAHDTIAVPGLWADIDIAGPGHKHTPCDGGDRCTHLTAAGRRQHHSRVLPLPGGVEQAMSIIAEAGLPEPTLVVHSGGGLYPWWLYEQPEVMGSPFDLEIAKSVSSSWQNLLAAAATRLGLHYGSGVGDLARVLRLPGTPNLKDGLERPCRIMSSGGPRHDATGLDHLSARLISAENSRAEREASAARTVAAVVPGQHSQARPAGAPVTAETPLDDFELSTSWHQILTPHGWSVHHAEAGGTVYWIRPGKTTQGWSATTGRAGDRDRMFVFSDDAGLPVQTAMNKAHVYGLINGFGGATRELAMHLRSSGYGQDRQTPTGGPVKLPGIGEALLAAYRSELAASGRAPQGQAQQHGFGPEPAPEAPRQLASWISSEDAQRALPQLDDAALHGVAGDFVRSVLPHTEAGAPALLFAFLASAGCHLGDRWYVGAGNTRQTAKVWPVLCGDTSSGAKGTAVSAVKSFWGVTDPFFLGQQVVGGLSSGEGLIKMVRDGNADTTQPGDGDHDPGVVDKRRWVNESEFASTLTRAGRDGNSLSAVLRQAYDWESLQTITSHSPLRATTPHIAVTAHITPHELVKSMSRVDAANGLGNRFMVVHTARSKLLARGSMVPQAELVRLRDRYLDARQQVWRATAEYETSGFEVTWTDAAGEIWDKVYADQFEAIERMPTTGHVRDMLGRWHANTTRLALIYALLDGKLKIDVEHLLAALACIRYTMASTAHVFEATVDDTALGKLEEFIGNSDETFIDPDGNAVAGVNRGDIGRKLFRNNISRTNMDQLLSMLIRRGGFRGMLVTSPTTGRTREVYVRSQTSRDHGTIRPHGGTVPQDGMTKYHE